MHGGKARCIEDEPFHDLVVFADDHNGHARHDSIEELGFDSEDGIVYPLADFWMAALADGMVVSSCREE